MLRAPICTTSACCAIASACCVSSSSVTTGRPVAARTSARIFSPSMPRPLNANGDVRGLKAPPRSIAAPAALTVSATLSVPSCVSTVHGPAIRQNVSPPPTVRPSTWNFVGAWCASSEDASLYGREIGTTRSTPDMPSSPSSITPCGSPIAPIAVVSSPGMVSTCTPVVSRRSTTARICSSLAPGAMTTIIGAKSYEGLQAEPAHAHLVEADVMGELVAHRARHLVAQQVGVVAEVAAQRVAEDDDPVVGVVAGGGVAHVQAVGAVAAAVGGDDDGDVLERVAQQVGQVVEGIAHELLEVLVVERVELEEVDLVGIGGDAVAGQALGAAHDLLELGLGLRVAPVGQARGDEHHEQPEARRGDDGDPRGLEQAQRERGAEALADDDRGDADAERDGGGEGDAAQRRGHRIALAMTSRWISLVPS